MRGRRYLAVDGCDSAERPCRNTACRYSLPGLAVESEDGEEPMPVYTCALDFAEDNADRGATLAAVGAQLGVTRERVRQIEAVALQRLVVGLRIIGAEPSPAWKEALAKAHVEVAEDGALEHVAPDAPLALEEVAALPKFAGRLALCRKVA